MSTRFRTRSGNNRNPRPDDNPLFGKLPPQYYNYALQWCSYDRWTIEEAANLLAGCVPHRQMFLRGKHHVALDEEVLEIENKIRGALGEQIKVVKSKKYFEKTYIESRDLVAWARNRDIDVPSELEKAEKEIRRRFDEVGYTTPCLEAAHWVVKTYWNHADLREPPTPGEIIHALLQQFPDLTGAECEMVEKITRHPIATPRESD